jgi:hypothetical protein
MLLHCPKGARQRGQYFREVDKIHLKVKEGSCFGVPSSAEAEIFLFPSILRTEQILEGVGLETTRRWGRSSPTAAGEWRVARAPLAGRILAGKMWQKSASS